MTAPPPDPDPASAAEADFWDSLESRACRELDGLRDRRHPGLWCDGFIPEAFETEGRRRAAVTGRVWMGRGPRHQEAWAFTLVLPKGVRSRDAVDWAALLPAEDVTGWLKVDPCDKVLTVDPGAAYPDPPVAAGE